MSNTLKRLIPFALTAILAATFAYGSTVKIRSNGADWCAHFRHFTICNASTFEGIQ